MRSLACRSGVITSYIFRYRSKGVITCRAEGGAGVPLDKLPCKSKEAKIYNHRYQQLTYLMECTEFRGTSKEKTTFLNSFRFISGELSQILQISPRKFCRSKVSPYLCSVQNQEAAGSRRSRACYFCVHNLFGNNIRPYRVGAVETPPESSLLET